MYSKILVPFDNSEPARRALENAMELVSCDPDAKITVLNVVEWHDYNAESFKLASRMAKASKEGIDDAALAEVGEEVESYEVAKVRSEIADIIGDAEGVSIAIVNGSPHETIVAYASDLDFDCIVMGHRGMGVIRGMLGSVAFSVLQKANKPVLVVK